MKHETLLKRLALTEAEWQELVNACCQTWQGIAGDIADAVRFGGKTRMSRSEVIEVTLDANRVEHFHGDTLSSGVLRVLRDYTLYKTLKAGLAEHFGAEQFDPLPKPPKQPKVRAYVPKPVKVRVAAPKLRPIGLNSYERRYRS